MTITDQVYRMLTPDERRRMELLIEENIINGFAELVDRTSEWLSTPAARDFFFERRNQINRFYRESGIEDEWQNIINARATRGADIAEQIYTYARGINSEGVVDFTPTERNVLNNICDNQYELVRNTTQYEVEGIRRSILQDVAEGVNPRQTSLREVQLQPINGLSPEQRAVMISRTETATIHNTARLMQFKEDGVELVEWVGGGYANSCDDCAAMEGQQMTVDEALETPIMHPNCGCTFRAVVVNPPGEWLDNNPTMEERI